MSEQRGRFIVFEGIDGAGKTTQISLLEAKFRAEGRRVMVTAEPTVSVTGGLLRDALGGISKRTAGEMAAMFVLDRIFHNVNPVTGIEKMLADGVDVICDRYYYSTLAYQGQSTDYAWVKSMNLSCPEIRKPDLCIYLDLTPAQSLERIRAGRDSVEIYENEETLTKVRNAFLSVLDDLSATDRIVRIDAYRTPEEIAKDIADAVDAL